MVHYNMTMTTMRLKRSAAVFQAIVFASLSLHYLANAAFVQRIASPAACSAGSHTLVRLRRRLLVSPLYLKRGGTKKKQDKGSTITVNKLAFRNYEVLEKWEAGIALQGTEVKR